MRFVRVLAQDMFLKIGSLVKRMAANTAGKRLEFEMDHSQVSRVAADCREGFLALFAVFSGVYLVLKETFEIRYKLIQLSILING